jgi:glycosyltransferase A (GT-A) superfamily protein (DUF2064 family)
MSERPTLIVMAKTPRLGVGKTRLAAGLGRASALRVNRFLQARTLRRLKGDRRWRLTLLVSPDRDVRQAMPDVWPRSIRRGGQGSGDLGMRLARAFSNIGARPAGVVGTDCPDQDRPRVAAAFRAAGRSGAAIGPTEDGGFWILCVRDARRAAPAFARVRWSSPHACPDMTRALENILRKRVAIVERLRDIDEAEDWRAYAQRAVARRVASIGR